jgi:acetyl-CoA carboxylase carboxyltransferase component
LVFHERSNKCVNKKEGEICRKANREFGLNKQKNAENKYTGLPTAAELRNALANVSATDAMARIKSLFDADTFVELWAYTKRSFNEVQAGAKDEEFAGVICGYGAVCGQLVFAFAQDGARMKGALDEAHAKKICALYDMAIKNGAPVVGIFD